MALAFGEIPGEKREKLNELIQRLAILTVWRLREATWGLQRVSRFLDSFTDLDSLLEHIMEEAKRVTGAEGGFLMLWDAHTEELYYQVVLGGTRQDVRRRRVRLGEGIAGVTARLGMPLNVPDVTRDGQWSEDVDFVRGRRTRSALSAPMLRHDRLIGVIEVLNRRDRPLGFNEDDEANLLALAGQAAIVIENARLHEEILRTERLAAVGKAVSELAQCTKNILTGIIGGQFLLEKAIQKHEPEEELHKGWDIVQRNTTSLSDLVMDMLAFARDSEPKFEETDVNSLVSSAVDLLVERAEDRHVVVECDLDPAIERARVEPASVYRMTVNLGTNALEACADDGAGRVWVRTRAGEPGWFVLEIEDNGIGIPEENRLKLFKGFFTTKGARGTGLGLAVTGKIVSEHGGRVEVMSEEGKGAQFVIHLPLSGEASVSGDEEA